jgi:hypothetical protein
MVAGNVNTPDPYQFATVASNVNQVIGNITGALDGAKALTEDLVGLVEGMAKG